MDSPKAASTHMSEYTHKGSSTDDLDRVESVLGGSDVEASSYGVPLVEDEDAEEEEGEIESDHEAVSIVLLVSHATSQRLSSQNPVLKPGPPNLTHPTTPTTRNQTSLQNHSPKTLKNAS